MRRREFIQLLGGAASAWPLTARSQQDGRLRRIGWLSVGSNVDRNSDRLNVFKRALTELGWIAGRNIAFVERWADGDFARLPPLATELASLRPDLIFVTNSPTLSAMRRATGIIPIVFAAIDDPVGQGVVSSSAHPGGNITGFASQEFSLATKNLELLKKMAPGLMRAGFLYSLGQPAATGIFAEIEAAAAVLRIDVAKTPVQSPADIESSIGALAREPGSGLFVIPSPVTVLHRELIVSVAVRHRLPSVYTQRSFVEDGGLASYSSNDLDLSRRAASYADRILKGEKPADLPVQLPTKIELVLNLKTARAMGLTLSPDVLALADEVIE